MVLSSAAASTQTTILPTARTNAFDGGLQGVTVTVRQDPPPVPYPEFLNGADGGGLDRPLRGHELHLCWHRDSGTRVTALGVLIAFYYGFTGLACFWLLQAGPHPVRTAPFHAGILPLTGWAIMWSIGGYSLVQELVAGAKKAN